MGDFFKPWRRKVGMVTLVMACCLMGAWMRGRIYSDRIGFGSRINGHEWESGPRGLSWSRDIDLVKDDTCDNSWYVQTGQHLWSDSRLRGFIGFEATDEVHDNKAGTYRKVEWIIPHWFVVWTTTLLSAYLLLSKPRPGTESA